METRPAGPGPGTRLGPYEILAPLSEGGMAMIFVARDTVDRWRGPIAIKVMKPRVSGLKLFRDMFLDEARLSALVRHRNVVRVGGLGEDRGTLYLPMEYLPGISLWDLMVALRRARRPLPVEIAAAIVLSVADGLHAAHEATNARGQHLDLIHRDVTPCNVLLTDDGCVKIIDFGLAMAKFRLSKTRPGVLKGKPGYVAPEQIAEAELDRRVDVYGLGVLMWEILTGDRLFPHTTHARMDERAGDCLIVPPDRWRRDIPPELTRLVMSCLHHDPARRPETAAAFAHALLRAVPRATAIHAYQLRAFVRSAMPSRHRSSGPLPLGAPPPAAARETDGDERWSLRVAAAALAVAAGVLLAMLV